MCPKRPRYVSKQTYICVLFLLPSDAYIHSTRQIFATHCNTLQHTATHCNTLQHNATHCNTLQRCSVLQRSTYPPNTPYLLTQIGLFCRIYTFLSTCVCVHIHMSHKTHTFTHHLLQIHEQRCMNVSKKTYIYVKKELCTCIIRRTIKYNTQICASFDAYIGLF